MLYIVRVKILAMISILNIKCIFFLLVFFSLTPPSFAQKGYKVIRKAEKNTSMAKMTEH